jgi:hypothetical protein
MEGMLTKQLSIALAIIVCIGLAKITREDGEVIRTRTGVRAHPLIREELSARAFFTRCVQRLGLNLEPLRSGVGRPPGAA